MTTVEIAPAVRQMLHTIIDDPRVAGLYRRPSTYGTVFGAWSDGELVGFYDANFDSNFHENPSVWSSFELPPAPHAYLIRIFVAAPARRRGVGAALVLHLADEAASRGCTLIGGTLDLSTDPDDRRRFFQRLGFRVGGRDHVVAAPNQLTFG